MANMFFKFLFIAEVWGTVSDWVMVIVTAITAVLLYKTLQEQKEFTKIELERFARENPPTFTSRGDLTVRGRRPSNPLRFRVALKNNRIRNLSITGDFPEGFKLTHDYNGLGSLPPDSEIFLAIEADPSTSPIECNGRITFEYDDMLNNRYSQVLHLTRASSLTWKGPYKISN